MVYAVDLLTWPFQFHVPSVNNLPMMPVGVNNLRMVLLCIGSAK